MRYIFDAKQIHNFKFCPFCGDKWVYVYDGDFCGHVQCSNLECDEELDFDILEEMVARFRERFKKSLFGDEK